MKQIILTEQEFKHILDGTQHTVSNDDARVALQYIRLDVARQSVMAYSLDGYRASRVLLKRSKENDDEFTCYIKPVPFKPTKHGALPVTISFDEKITTLDIRTFYGSMCYRFECPNSDFPNIEKVYQEAEVHDREVGVNAKYIAQAMQAIAKMNHHIDHCCVIEGKESPTQPIIIRAKCESMENTQLILPIRILEGNIK